MLTHHSGHLDLVYGTHSSASVLESKGFPCFLRLSFPWPASQPCTTVGAACCVKTFFKLCVKGSYKHPTASTSWQMRSHLKAEHHSAFLSAVAVPFLPLFTCTCTHTQGASPSLCPPWHRSACFCQDFIR